MRPGCAAPITQSVIGEPEQTSLEMASRQTLRHLARALLVRDSGTHPDTDRIADISAILARALEWPAEQVEMLALAAPMHDVGKIGIPDRILLKPGELTGPERTEMQRHTTIGHDILLSPGSGLMSMAATIALTHHERVDGRGYPHGRAGSDIPEVGRIVAVADVFDALVNDRVYRPALPVSEAREIMAVGCGRQFDERIVEALFRHLDEVLALEPTAVGRP